jgi:hypothetical protein
MAKEAPAAERTSVAGTRANFRNACLSGEGALLMPVRGKTRIAELVMRSPSNRLCCHHTASARRIHRRSDLSSLPFPSPSISICQA